MKPDNKYSLQWMILASFIPSLRGACELDNLRYLELPPCTWTVALGQGLGDCVVRCKNLDSIEIGRGSIKPGHESAFLPFALALEKTSLTRIVMTWCGNVDEAFVTIAKGVGLSQEITSLTLRGTDLSMATASQALHAIQFSDTLSCLCLNDTTRDVDVKDITDEIHSKIVASITVNTGLCYVHLPAGESDKVMQLNHFVKCICRLNFHGRSYIKNPNDPGFRKQAICVFAAINKSTFDDEYSLDRLYLHLLEVSSMLFY
jgi:hypothetical protein